MNKTRKRITNFSIGIILAFIFIWLGISFLWLYLGLILWGIFAIIRNNIILINEMLNPNDLLFSIDKDINLSEDSSLQTEFGKAQMWAESKSLEFHSCLFYKTKVVPQLIRIFIWISRDKTRLFTMSYLNKANFDFATSFDNSYSITTTSVKPVYPRLKKSLIQIFPSKTLDQLWDIHLEAETLIKNTTDANYNIFPDDILSVVKNDMKKQAEYVKTIFGWQVKFFYWFFIYRNLISNKKVTSRSLKSIK